MSVTGVLEELQEEFRFLPDAFTRYSYLVELAELLPAPTADLLQEQNRYLKCQSQVWLQVSAREGNCIFNGYSDTLMVRGVLALFRELLHGQPVEEVLALRLDLLTELDLTGQIGARRVEAMAGLLPEIQRRLQRAMSAKPAS